MLRVGAAQTLVVRPLAPKPIPEAAAPLRSLLYQHTSLPPIALLVKLHRSPLPHLPL
jgi:hypothetical protein